MHIDTVKYFLRVLKWSFDPKLKRCPSCGSTVGTVVDRKWLLTSLVRCRECGLAYRRPQEPETFSEEFYQEEYQSSLATRMPNPEQLEGMKRVAFRGTEKDFFKKIELLRCLNIQSDGNVLDFGASWGYGVYQLNHLGYRGRGLELSRPRAKYGESQLGVEVATDEFQLPANSFDAVFTNHVLEHIPNPMVALNSIFRLLRSGGFLVAFFPNGSTGCQQAKPKSFHCHWGRLHPIYLTDEYLQKSLGARPWLMGSIEYGSPPPREWVEAWDQKSQVLKDVSQTEFMLIVRA